MEPDEILDPDLANVADALREIATALTTLGPRAVADVETPRPQAGWTIQRHVEQDGRGRAHATLSAGVQESWLRDADEATALVGALLQAYRTATHQLHPQQLRDLQLRLTWTVFQ